LLWTLLATATGCGGERGAVASDSGSGGSAGESESSTSASGDNTASSGSGTTSNTSTSGDASTGGATSSGATDETASSSDTASTTDTGLETDTICGNGVLGLAEECDDGNLDDNDGCSASCVRDRWPGVSISGGQEAGFVVSADGKLFAWGIRTYSGRDFDTGYHEHPRDVLPFAFESPVRAVASGRGGVCLVGERASPMLGERRAQGEW
jgi:cysteine-rich repeat protein